MPPVVIRVENLSKRYVLRHQAARSGEGLRHAIEDTVKAPLRAWRRWRRGGATAAAGSPTQEEFWALKEVSFEIRQGEVVGIIGRNGAGKSTLLKILSRITEPTAGRIGLKGRVASLLEVGTGFHPELTGRENIYLNGAILGMTRAEVKSKFDEIVDFAGVEKFLDTPVKRYSSGMYVRLAFAVAAHLEPEILIVDEVLAVGDAEFQKKCLGKMKDVAGHGRTVLFVSHNMGAVTTLCTSGILLSAGSIEQSSTDIAHLVQKYQSPNSGHDLEVLPLIISNSVELQDIEIRMNCGPQSNDAVLKFYFMLHEPEYITDCAALIYNTSGQRLGVLDARPHCQLPRQVEKGLCKIEFTCRAMPLIAGVYKLGLYFKTSSSLLDNFNLCSFQVSDKTAHTVSPYHEKHLGFVKFSFNSTLV